MLLKDRALVCDRYLKEIEVRIASDRRRGATQLYLDALLILKKWMEHEVPDEVCFKRMLAALVRGQPSMAPMLNLANDMLLALEMGWDRVFQKVESALKGLSESMDRIVKAGVERLSCYGCFITTSYSSTVRELFRGIAGVRRVSLVVSKGDPFAHGLNLARELSDEDIDISITFDALAPYLVKDVQAAVVGADAVEERGVVNGAGTFPLALAARHWGVPLFVVCSTDKFLPPLLSRYHVIKDESVELDGVEGFPVVHRAFDVTPVELVTAFITEKGVMGPEEYREFIATKSVSGYFHSLLEEY